MITTGYLCLKTSHTQHVNHVAQFKAASWLVTVQAAGIWWDFIRPKFQKCHLFSGNAVSTHGRAMNICRRWIKACLKGTSLQKHVGRAECAPCKTKTHDRMVEKGFEKTRHFAMRVFWYSYTGSIMSCCAYRFGLLHFRRHDNAFKRATENLITEVV